MKKIIVSIALLGYALNHSAQGFGTSAVNFNLPNGGKINGGTTFGYNAIGGSALTSENTGSQTWAITDMNGDGKGDLLIAAQLQGGNVTSFSPSSNQYWKVYLNTGTAFDSNPTNWNLPAGGKISGGITYGYNAIGGSAFSTDNTGSQSWSLMDMNADKLPDLVVTAQLQGGNVTSFSPSSNQYWKVYLNTGSSFDINPTNWNLPAGGKITGGNTYGFNNIGGVAVSTENTGSQTWSVVDVNNDKKPDLIITAQLQGGNVTSFSPSSNQYWKVYLNTGTAFDGNVTNWNLPAGGKISGGITYGYNSLSGTAASTDNTGSQSWSVVNLDNSAFLDLVVTAQLQGGNVTSFSPTSNQYWMLYTSNGTGFSNVSSNFNLPNGGKITGGINYGFDAIAGFANASNNTGSQTWSVNDLNGDGLGDLIVTGQLQGGDVTSFSPTSNQYWKMYVNNGNNFDSNPTNWNLPNGGKITGSVTYGFDASSGFAISTHNTGSQTWSVIDIDGDNLLDLVVAAQLQGGNVTSFSPSSNQYWMTYKNTLVNIKEYNKENFIFSVYPNPANDLLNVTLTAEKQNNHKTFFITNTLGQIVHSEKITSNNFSVDISNLKSGLYFLKINSLTQKFIKN